MEEKLGPWLPAFRDVFGELSEQRLDQLSKFWEAVPVGMLRGRTITDATLIVDEAQNCTYSQLKC
ncbi:PhoH family protein, partial [Lacticaseibacillus paracasei]